MSRHILLVDDEPQMLAGMKEILLRAGFRISAAASGIEAAARLKEVEIPYDLVITDLKMPRFNGLDLIRQIQQNHPLTRVILITAYGTVDSAVEAMKMGAVDYLLKPFNSDMLLSAVNKALGTGSNEQVEEREIITQNEKMLRLMNVAAQAARTDATILIEAESGTGKELLARFIHSRSPRKSAPFIAVNCAALPDNLLESELMGHEKGAFTGAASAKPGKFELAHGGTILLDEIGEMAPLLQAKILRVLQEKEIDRIGGVQPIPVNVRVIATTNRNLARMVEQGEFRQDLFFRLNVIPLRIPPLRERMDDIPSLAEYFLNKYSPDPDTDTRKVLAGPVLNRLRQLEWPGNVRELENVIHRAVVLGGVDEVALGEPVHPKGNGTAAEPSLPAGLTLREMEQKLITSTLEKTGGNRAQAARMLQISVRTLRNKLKEMELSSATG